MALSDEVRAHTSPPGQPISAEDLKALGKAEPSITVDHSPPTEERDTPLSEEDLLRILIDLTNGKTVVGKTPYESELIQRLKDEIAAIPKLVEIPSEIPDLTEETEGVRNGG